MRATKHKQPFKIFNNGTSPVLEPMKSYVDQIIDLDSDFCRESVLEIMEEADSQVDSLTEDCNNICDSNSKLQEELDLMTARLTALLKGLGVDHVDSVMKKNPRWCMKLGSTIQEVMRKKVTDVERKKT